MDRNNGGKNRDKREKHKGVGMWVLKGKDVYVMDYNKGFIYTTDLHNAKAFGSYESAQAFLLYSTRASGRDGVKFNSLLHPVYIKEVWCSISSISPLT